MRLETHSLSSWPRLSLASPRPRSRGASHPTWHRAYNNTNKHYSTTPPCLATSRSTTTTDPNEPLNPNDPKRIAILGGGIQGLVFAYQILRKHEQWFPNHAPPHITIYEKNSACGGWLKTVRCSGPWGTAVFEQGAHSIRNSRMVLPYLSLVGQIFKPKRTGF